ncbi:MAG TPA: hypothetical protein PLZ36_15325 [Armatimonadota bacterium]|nr:hypothetical protein [Armatimonadota bacterium]
MVPRDIRLAAGERAYRGNRALADFILIRQCLSVQCLFEYPSDILRHRNPFTLGRLMQPTALPFGQLNLRTNHITTSKVITYHLI